MLAMPSKGNLEFDKAVRALNALGYRGGYPEKRDSGYGRNVRFFIDPDDQVRHVLIQTRTQQPGTRGGNYWFGLAFEDFGSVDWVALWVEECSKLYVIPPGVLQALLEKCRTSGRARIERTQWLTDVDPTAELLWGQGVTDEKISLGEYVKVFPSIN
jgi:hypothetical protein